MVFELLKVHYFAKVKWAFRRGRLLVAKLRQLAGVEGCARLMHIARAALPEVGSTPPYSGLGVLGI